ncbi:MAG: sporulation protein Cse60 [Acholeplasmatales bacterium]|nr:sporulation protein Cse60 [Acholeplasmatales bacterium]
MKVKIFDFEHEVDLENAINNFIKNKKIIDIKYQNSHFYAGNEQIYSFSALIIYENDTKIYDK